MNKFRNSIGRIIDYSKLSDFLFSYTDQNDIFVDVGCGYCDLIIEMMNKYSVSCFGIEKDYEKVSWAQEQRLSVFHHDILSESILPVEVFGLDKVLHAGFCLFNVFSDQQVNVLFRNISKDKSIKRVILEIQNHDYFSKNYSEGVWYKQKLGDVVLKSMSSIVIANEECLVKKITMLYEDANGLTINKTEDVLYCHKVSRLIQIAQENGFSVITNNDLNFRNTMDKECSHFYLICGRYS